ncbi:MAG TPA: hypothetical protein VMU25_02085 [Candidatus Paceibacterota bacterium]|nr:hypothetical protein [Candidatus Paceibacterota bacterium]
MRARLFTAIVFVMLLCTARAHALAQFPDPQRLQPPPQNAHPDVSHNVNRTATSNEVIVVPDDTSPADASAPAPEVPLESQNNTLRFAGVAAFVLALISLAVVWRMLRE